MPSQLRVFFDGVIVSYLLNAVAMASVGASMPCLKPQLPCP